MSAISWTLRLSVNEGQLESFRALMGEMVSATEQEDGTRGYEWFVSSDGNVVHIHERYTDSGAALIHLGSFGANFAERFLSMVTPTSLTVYGSPSPELKGALDGFGAEYLGDFGGFSR